MVYGAANTAVGAQFAQCQFEVFCNVCGDANGFTYCGNTACTAGCCNGVFQREFGVDVEVATGHGEVLCDGFCVARFQGAQLTEGSTVQLATGDVVVDFRRLGLCGAVACTATDTAYFFARCFCLGTVGARCLGSGVGATAVELLASAVVTLETALAAKVLAALLGAEVLSSAVLAVLAGAGAVRLVTGGLRHESPWEVSALGRVGYAVDSGEPLPEASTL